MSLHSHQSLLGHRTPSLFIGSHPVLPTPANPFLKKTAPLEVAPMPITPQTTSSAQTAHVSHLSSHKPSPSSLPSPSLLHLSFSTRPSPRPSSALWSGMTSHTTSPPISHHHHPQPPATPQAFTTPRPFPSSAHPSLDPSFTLPGLLDPPALVLPLPRGFVCLKLGGT